MPRKRKTRSYTATDDEQEQMRRRLPYEHNGEDFTDLSRLIVYAVLRLPPKR